MSIKIKELMSQLSLEEKVSLLSGFDYWSTKEIKRLGIPRLFMADGPHGLRKQKKNELGIDRSYPSTCFPTAALLACSWDEELAQKQGEAIGKEARSLGLSCVLGPGINIKRSPLCGRNFEYFSEEPLLSGKMGAGIVNGLQSCGVSACLKHFAVNNQEDYRFWVDVKANERTLREIYLASFEYALMYSKPKAVMCSYNKINGIYSSENRWLLTEVLREDFGYDGIVMSDWGAVNNRAQGVWAGLDLEMPGSYGINDNEVLKSVRGESPFIESTEPRFDNTLSEEEINTCTERILRFISDLESTTVPKQYDLTHHHELAREIAAESMVLLENNGILPLKNGIKVAVTGDMAIRPVYQGGGSSRIVPTEVDIPLDCIGKYADVTYIENNNTSKLSEFDAVIVFAGMPDNFDTEGSDRTSMRLPEEQLRLIEQARNLNKNTVVVLCAGAPVEVPESPAVLMAYFGGQAMGGAVADLLFGVKNPCGKLAETFPYKIEDTPCYLNFPGDGVTVNYGEGVYVGYRWYNKMQIKPKYPFGYGLSYTKFEQSVLEETEKSVTVCVANTGDYDGKDVVFVYEDGILRGFKKVFVKKGESVEVEVEKSPLPTLYTVNSTLQSPSTAPKVTMYTEVRKLYHIPNGRSLLNEIGGKFGADEAKVEKLINTRDCSSFVGNMLRNMVTMFDLGWTFKDLQKRIDKINKQNGEKGMGK
ncbi:MAG: glycoside hydrolase family 3 C-terminal domain-containing protein [Oscillospiraceae bacterium]|nr:glycoside hydrolase family 3 C-terminal domain-containing protein [Oscillospiraceae bacterium]